MASSHYPPPCLAKQIGSDACENANPRMFLKNIWQGLGYTATDAECDKYSEQSYNDAKRIFDKWVPEDVRSQINSVTEASFLLFITNVGSGGKGIKDGFVWLKNGRHSSMLRYLQAGNIEAACGEFNKWANAGGKPVRGLQIRRVDETGMCGWPDD